MKPESDELSVALEALRDRPIVTESRDYARRWEQARARALSVRGVVFASAGAIAAACMAVYAAVAVWPALLHPASDSLVATGIGETRAVPLDDGSRVVLDTSSRLRVEFTPTARDVELLGGQAHFEVAKDPHRPFRVHTRSAEVVAVGTMFDVAALPARTTVTLIEGRVNVRVIPSKRQERPRVEALTPGQQLGIAADGELLDKKVVKIENVTAWQHGTIVIDDAPLPEALAIMNRYSATQIVVEGPSLQDRRISGVFRIGDVDTEAVVLQRYFGLSEAARSEHEIVLRK
jgi:transmembrane sensor